MCQLPHRRHLAGEVDTAVVSLGLLAQTHRGCVIVLQRGGPLLHDVKLSQQVTHVLHMVTGSDRGKTLRVTSGDSLALLFLGKPRDRTTRYLEDNPCHASRCARRAPGSGTTPSHTWASITESLKESITRFGEAQTILCSASKVPHTVLYCRQVMGTGLLASPRQLRYSTSYI